jgi:AcrR family transcriptional regulator
VTPPAAPGRREQTKLANRAMILAAARDVFGELGYGAATVRDVIRRTDLAAGTFYNYFPDKEAVFRALVEDNAAEAGALAREARARATTTEDFVETGFRAFFAFIAEDPDGFDLLRRNAGTVRAMFDGPAIGATVGELTEDLRRAVDAGLIPPHDAEFMAAAMLGSAFEIGMRAAERDPFDVDGATRLCADIFLGGFERMRAAAPSA